MYDVSDADWFLVSDASHTFFGFVPSNYVELGQQKKPDVSPVATMPSAGSRMPSFQSNSHEEEGPAYPPRTLDRGSVGDESPPPMPSRPGTADIYRREELPPPETSVSQEDSRVHEFDGEYFIWHVDEIDGRKKKGITLSIGNGKVKIKPNSPNPKKLTLKSSSSIDEEWPIRDLTNFSHEKKHLFLEFRHPTVSIEVHTGSKDVAEAIVLILGDLKGSEQARGLREVAHASHATVGGVNYKAGRVLYRFEAQAKDELDCEEGDEVYIIDDSKSRDWWLCQNLVTRSEGVVPSSYIEITGSRNLNKLMENPEVDRSFKSSRGRVVPNKANGQKYGRHHSRDERNQIREHDRIQRDHYSLKSRQDRSKPNLHRVRTWIDSTGSYKVEAEFLGYGDGKVHLHKTNGVKISVAAEKLSLEDLDYVEKLTGYNLDPYKEDVQKQQKPRRRHSSGLVPRSGDASQIAARAELMASKESDYDWFDFFLSCGIDLGNCQRYSLNFSREKIDENLMEDITPSLLRTLGLREGDILRVMKHLDNKFNRGPKDDSGSTGGLFTQPTGALKNNNSTSSVSRVSADELPSSAHKDDSNRLFEDDAWAIKPASKSNEELKPPMPQRPQYTGSLQDLVDIKPLELKSVPNLSSSGNEQKPALAPLTPNKTAMQKPSGNVAENKTGSNIPPNLVQVQKTGGLIPVQPTGFVPIAAQPTGFIPIQATGVIQPQPTYGIFGVTPQKTGGLSVPQTSFGQPIQSLHTGTSFPQTTFGQSIQPIQTGVPIPQTTFGQSSLPSQLTGGIPQQRTGLSNQPSFPNIFLQQSQPQFSNQQSTLNLFSQPTGPVQSGPMPATSFGSFPRQPTGPLVPSQFTGVSNAPQTSFGGPGSINDIPSLNPQPTNFGLFGPPPIQQPSFDQPSFNQPSFNQPNFNQPNFNQPSFNQPNFNQPNFNQPSFNQPSFNQPSFNQPSFNQPQSSMNQLSGLFQNASLNSQPPPSYSTGPQMPPQMPNTTFGQQPNYITAPLQSQPTGAGFGNAPGLQSQPTGSGRANLSAATPDNPFGF